MLIYMSLLDQRMQRPLIYLERITTPGDQSLLEVIPLPSIMMIVISVLIASISLVSLVIVTAHTRFWSLNTKHPS